MVLIPEENGCWLESGVLFGLDIRDEVRMAAAEVWRIAAEKTRMAIGDSTETACLMEVAATKASRFLDRIGEGAADANTKAVLLRIFCRLLNQRGSRLRRLDPVGRGVEINASIPSWENEIVVALLWEKLRRNMTAQGVRILSLRRIGYVWDEIAVILDSSVPAVKKRFWRDIRHAKRELGITTPRKTVAP